MARRSYQYRVPPKVESKPITATLRAFAARGAAEDYARHLRVCAGNPPAGAGLLVISSGVAFMLDLTWDPDCDAHKRWARIVEQIVEGEQNANKGLGEGVRQG